MPTVSHSFFLCGHKMYFQYHFYLLKSWLSWSLGNSLESENLDKTKLTVISPDMTLL